jgi:non-canonical purine NTP pyrophosphatase (RdgB/HAM1 family)
MKKISFVTGNNSKFEQVNKWVKQLHSNIELEQLNLDIPEYQSLDIHYIATNKANEAWKIIKKPLIVDDFGIYLENYNKFPGPFAKYIYQGIGLEGFWKIAKDNPRGVFCSCFVYVNKDGSHQIFEGKFSGKFIEPNVKILDQNFPYTYIFIPDGSDKTLAEIKGTADEQNFNHRFKAVKNWIESIK